MPKFEKKPSLGILSCPSCKATGHVGNRRCPTCRGASFGRLARGRWLCWNFSLTRYRLALLKGRRIFNKIRRITFAVLWLNAWLWAGFLIYRSGQYQNFIAPPENWLAAATTVGNEARFLFWLGAIFLGYFCYRGITEKKVFGGV